MGCISGKPDTVELVRGTGSNPMKFFVRANLRDTNQNVLPGLPSNLATATIFSYMERKPQVVQMLQSLSHTGRYYIVAQNGLPGFLVEFNILGWV